MPHECTNCDRTFPDGSKEMLSGCPDCGGNKFRYRPAGGKLDATDGTDSGGDQNGKPAAGADTDADSGTGGDAGATGGSTPTADPESTPAGSAGDADRSGVGGPQSGDPPDPPGGPGGRSGVANTVAEATRNLREWVGVDEDRREGPPFEGDDPGGLGDQFDPRDEDDAVVEEGSERETDPEDAAQASARTSMVEPDDLPDGAGSDPSGGEPAGPGEASRDAGDPGEGTPPDGSAELAELREELNDQFESIKIVEPGQYELNLMELYDREEYIISLMEDGRYAIEVPETWRDPGE